MSELAVRLIVVGAVAVVLALLIVMALRGGRSRSPASVTLSGLGLGPGFVLFTSATCPSCADARDVADRVLGPGRYVERAWEDDPDALTAAGIDEVPLVVVMGRRGRVRSVLRGVPDPFRLRVERIRSRF